MPGRMTKAQRDAFLAGRHVAVLVTNGADGVPVPTPIWYVMRGGAFLFRTASDAVKTENIRRDPRVSICVQDERAPYRAVVAYGHAEIAPADATLARAMPQRYLGFVGAIGYRAAASAAIEQGPEVTLVVRPERFASYDFGMDTPLAGRVWLTIKRILPPWL
jgi:PPOX class probable F420-dependent enzyme